MPKICTSESHFYIVDVFHFSILSRVKTQILSENILGRDLIKTHRQQTVNWVHCDDGLSVFSVWDLAGGQGCSEMNVAASLVLGSRDRTCCLDAVANLSQGQDAEDSRLCFSNKVGEPWENVKKQPDCPLDMEINFIFYTPHRRVATPSESMQAVKNTLLHLIYYSFLLIF